MERNLQVGLMSEQGIYHRGMRPIEPEAVFGQIKLKKKLTDLL